jgi:hypothetical protein
MRQAFPSILTAAALAPFWNQPAQAIPHVYAGLVLGSSSMEGCSTKLGGAAIAVAGMNNDDTLAMMKKVYNDFRERPEQAARFNQTRFNQAEPSYSIPSRT